MCVIENSEEQQHLNIHIQSENPLSVYSEEAK